jgi:hypothetical protein
VVLFDGKAEVSFLATLDSRDEFGNDPSKKVMFYKGDMEKDHMSSS